MENYTNFENNKNGTNEIGGILFVLTYLSDYLPYSILSAIGVIVGVLGNLLIIITVIANKELHSSTFILIFNLALADITISGFVDSTTLAGMFLGKSYFDQRPALCDLIATVCLVTCITSLFNLGFLAFSSYIQICHNNLYKKLFRKKLTFLYCIISWLIGFAMDIPNYTGWGGHYYDEKTLSCLWNRLASQSYSIFFPMSSIIVPSMLIIVFYVKIFMFSYRSKSRSNSANHNQSIRLAKGLFASFMLFACCWMPFGFLVMIDFADKAPRAAVMYTMTFAHLNSAFNPILYAVFNSAFKRGCEVLFRRIFCLPSIAKRNSQRVAAININSTRFAYKARN